MPQPKILWLIAFAVYVVGDTVTTFANLKYGAIELNPIINVYTMIPLKISIFLILYRISRCGLVPTILIIVGFVGIIFNMLSL